MSWLSTNKYFKKASNNYKTNTKLSAKTQLLPTFRLLHKCCRSSKTMSPTWFCKLIFLPREFAPLAINPSSKKVTICASEAKPKQRGEAPVCTRNTIAKGKGDEED
jgi:hypothetical protein